MPQNANFPGRFYDYGGAAINSMHPLFAATGDGVADDRAALVLADAAAVAEGVPLILRAPHRIATAYTFLADVRVAPGAELVVEAEDVTFTHLHATPGPFHWITENGVGRAKFPAKVAARPEWWNVDGTDDNVQIERVLNCGAKKVRFLNRGTYNGHTNSATARTQLSVPNGVTLRFNNATFNNIGFYNQVGAAMHMEGRVTLYGDPALTYTSYGTGIGIFGTGCSLDNAEIRGLWSTCFALAADSQRAMIGRILCDAFNYTALSDCIQVEGKDHVLGVLECLGYDDPLVFKCPTEGQIVENIAIGTLIIRNSAAAISVGTEINGIVRNITIGTVSCVNTSRGLWLKVGTLQALRGGTLQNFTIGNLTHTDLDGTRAANTIEIKALCNCKILDVTINNVSFYGRTLGGGAPQYTAYIAADGSLDLATDTDGTTALDPAQIRRVTIRTLKVKDRFGGVASGGTWESQTAVGEPVGQGVRVEELSGGIVDDITIDGAEIDGTAQHAYRVATASGSRVRFWNCRSRNAGQASLSMRALSTAGATCDLEVKNFGARNMGLGQDPIELSDTTTLRAEQETMALYGTIAAGTSVAIPIWTAPVGGGGAYVHRAYVGNGAALATHATNYTTVSVEKASGGATLLSTSTNATALSGESATRIGAALPSVANAHLAPLARLRFRKADTGTGAALTNPAVTICYLPY